MLLRYPHNGVQNSPGFEMLLLLFGCARLFVGDDDEIAALRDPTAAASAGGVELVELDPSCDVWDARQSATQRSPSRAEQPDDDAREESEDYDAGGASGRSGPSGTWASRARCAGVYWRFRTRTLRLASASSAASEAVARATSARPVLLYVSRADAASRRIADEADVVALLGGWAAAHRYRLVARTLGDLPLREQLSLWSQVRRRARATATATATTATVDDLCIRPGAGLCYRRPSASPCRAPPCTSRSSCAEERRTVGQETPLARRATRWRRRQCSAAEPPKELTERDGRRKRWSAACWRRVRRD